MRPTMRDIEAKAFRLLTVSDAYPAPDRNSADFRLAKLLNAMGDTANVSFLALDEFRPMRTTGRDDARNLASALEQAGIQIVRHPLRSALRETQYDAVLFEWHFTARNLVEEVRLLQPRAPIIVDSVDVVYNRLEAKARVTTKAQDFAKAHETKAVELEVYKSADLVITVTDADAQLLHLEQPDLRTFTIPNIHPMQSAVSIPERHDNTLLFIGSFVQPGGETNADAMIYFCSDILPKIVAAVPDVKVKIIGSSPTPAVLNLASDRVSVLGFVADTKPHFASTAISIAPLRFGGGMKGKIGEAMSFGLPVVTTSVGVEGFGLEAGKHAIVADSPTEFANAVIHLLHDRAALDEIRMAGYRFIRENYSDVSVKRRVDALFSDLHRLPVKQLPVATLWRSHAKQMWDRHMGWRLRR